MKERCEACRETRARFSRPETQKARKSGLHREHHPATDLIYFSGARRELGHASATPTALASAAFRVPTQSAQALCFLGGIMKKAS